MIQVDLKNRPGWPLGFYAGIAVLGGIFGAVGEGLGLAPSIVGGGVVVLAIAAATYAFTRVERDTAVVEPEQQSRRASSSG